MIIVMTKMLNGACRLMTINPFRTFGLTETERTSAVVKLGIFRIRYGCILGMVAQIGQVRSLCLSSSISGTRATTSQLMAQIRHHSRPSRNVSSQTSCNLYRDSTKEGHKQTDTGLRNNKNNSEKNSSSEVPRTPQNPATVSPPPQTPEATKPKSLLKKVPADRSDKTPAKSTQNATASKRVEQTSKSGISSSSLTKKLTNATSLAATATPKASTSSKKKTQKQAPVSDKNVKKHNKSSPATANREKITVTKGQPHPSTKSRAETGNQGNKSGNQWTSGSNSTNHKKTKTTSAKLKLKVENNSKAETVHQGNKTGNLTTSGGSTINRHEATSTSAKPQPHLGNEAGSQDIETGDRMFSHLSDSTMTSDIADPQSGQRSSGKAGQKSSRVTPTSAHIVASENVGATRTNSVDSMKSAIINEPCAISIEPDICLARDKNNFFSTMQYKCMSLPTARTANEVDRRGNDFLDRYGITSPQEKLLSLDKGIESADDLIEGKINIKSKPLKKEKRHNWITAKTPQAYLQPFMDVSIFCGMVQEAQSLFNSARQHGQALETEHYNTMLQAWSRKGDLAQVRSVFSQMIASGVKPDLQSYAAALECMARMKGTDHSTVTKCLDQMASQKLSVSDIFHACTFTNDTREVILHLLQDVRPGFVAPHPAQRPQCQLDIVQDLYRNVKSPLKTDVNTDAGILSQEVMLSKLNEQMTMEKIETVQVPSIEQENVLSNHTLSKRAILAEHRQFWRQALQAALKYEIQKLKKRNDPRRATVGKLNFYPFLSVMEPDEYVELMLGALQGLAASTEGSMTVSLARELGYRVQRKFRIRWKIKTGVADKMLKLYKEFVSKSLGGGALNHRALWQSLEDSNPEGPTVNADVYGWPATITLGLGSLLADIMTKEVKINANMANTRKDKKMIPALYYMYTYRSFKQVGYIKPHPSLVELLQQAKEPLMPFESNLLPMLCPPVPWTSVKFGAYPLSTTKIMRCRDDAPQHRLLLEKSKSAELYPVLDSLSQLAAVPWMVNKPVLDVIIGVFRDGGSEVLDVAQPPSVLPPIPKPTGETTPEELAKIQQQRAILRKRQAEMHSLRMDMLYKLSIANKYRDEFLWFPHNMDFRGRVYPCPPHLNHMGSDVTRSILSFAKGLPLGKDGLHWLKLHLVNLTGHKKRCSLAERLAYANEMLPEIVDSAENPLEGNGWWTTAEDKWQVLACCIEVNNILNHRGDPSTYISHLPIHQDGSCNGLQHYAALGRDVIGAYQVNLSNTEVPQDVYSGVAQMVEDICKKDATNGLPIAKLLQGQIHRKVVKQTVMTIVYGVTLYGGKLQILKQLKDVSDIPADQRQYAASYLVLKVFQSLRKMFTKTREIQDWLTDCAWLISKAGQTVEWVTPLGLPVVQPYYKKNLRVINHADRIMYHEDRSDNTERPDSIKQKNAFPPNFIHSLDSTHMMLTSLHCHRANINFASVHDCFWTHACSIPTMNRICREQFVRLHSEEILQILADFMLEKYGHLAISNNAKVKKANPELITIGDYIIQVPQKGDFDLSKVLQSTFFFS